MKKIISLLLFLCVLSLQGAPQLSDESKQEFDSLLAANNAAKNPDDLILGMHSLKDLRQYILKANISKDVASKNNLLLSIARYNCPIIIQWVIDNGADVHVKNDEGNTPLHFAAHYGNSDVVEVLVHSGADVNATNRYGMTPSYLARLHNNKTITDILKSEEGRQYPSSVSWRREFRKATDLNHDFDIYRNSNNALLFRWFAIYHNENLKNMNSLDDLKRFLFEADQKEKNDLLITAVALDRGLIVQLLLDHGADVKDVLCVDQEGNTPLHLAVLRGNVEIAQLLLDHGADINAQNNDGNTPLHLDMYTDDVRMTHLLLAAKADTKIKNHSGDKPRDIADAYPIRNQLKFEILQDKKLKRVVKNRDDLNSTCSLQ